MVRYTAVHPDKVLALPAKAAHCQNHSYVHHRKKDFDYCTMLRSEDPVALGRRRNSSQTPRTDDLPYLLVSDVDIIVVVFIMAVHLTCVLPSRHKQSPALTCLYRLVPAPVYEIEYCVIVDGQVDGKLVRRGVSIGVGRRRNRVQHRRGAGGAERQQQPPYWEVEQPARGGSRRLEAAVRWWSRGLVHAAVAWWCCVLFVVALRGGCGCFGFSPQL